MTTVSATSSHLCPLMSETRRNERDLFNQRGDEEVDGPLFSSHGRRESFADRLFGATRRIRENDVRASGTMYVFNAKRVTLDLCDDIAERFLLSPEIA